MLKLHDGLLCEINENPHLLTKIFSQPADKERRSSEQAQRDLRMKLLTQIEGIDENLNQVKEDIKSKMAESASKIDSIEHSYAASIAQLNRTIEGLEAKLMEKIDSSIRSLVERQERLFLKMEESLARQNDEVAVFKTDAAGLIDMVSEVSEKITDFEKNKRNNLIFYGIPDDPKETPSILDAKVSDNPNKASEKFPGA